MSTVTETPLAHATLFRFATAGSVDDGKSTLVGRLLHDSKAILADTLDAVTRTSATRGFGGENGSTQRIDLALLTDGLRAEREQGITIDVAYRYFTTNRRSFILADCPGHVQYTKNTVTGASTADAVVVLIDARKGVLEQTRRHLSVLRLLRVPNVLVAVNKIDLVDFREDIFRAIEADLQSVAAEIGLTQVVVVPVSALEGDNVVDRSAHTPWYTGPSLLDVLETLPTTDEVERGLEPLRFPVQLVIRPQGALAPELVFADDAGASLRDRRNFNGYSNFNDYRDFRDYRAYAGQLASGSVSVGEQITVLPSGRSATVIGIDFAGQSLQRAVAPQSVSLRLSEEIDIARGDVIAATGTFGEVSQDLCAELCWLSSKPLHEGSKVLIKHGSRTVQALIRAVVGKLDLETFGYEGASVLELNDIGTARIRLSSVLPIETYALHRRTGAFLVIDPQDGNTLAAGLVKDHPVD